MSLTQHALDRYMERSGSTKILKSLFKIESLVANAVQIGKNQFYAGGWIMKVVHGEVVTMYRPKYPSQLRKVYKAMNP